MDTEIFVVDNNSVDGSVKMIKEKFPDIRLIANKENAGFSTANNQAMRKARGEYILLLNPDTIVEDDTFRKCAGFMDEHQDAGGLGVKMLDGKGKYLPESKRGLPSPSVGFFKIFGLSALFPKSKIFGKYHLGYLDKDKTHSVDVLAGAFMLLRKKTLDKIGLFDEQYNIYGEDIDFCIRAKDNGFISLYTPDTIVYHKVSLSTGVGGSNIMTPFRSYYYGRNMLLLVKKRKHGASRVSCAMGQTFILVPYYFFLISAQKSKGAFRSYLRGYLDAVLLVIRNQARS